MTKIELRRWVAQRVMEIVFWGLSWFLLVTRAAAAGPGTADVYFSLAKFNLVAATNRNVVLRPVSLEGAYGNILLGDPTSVNSGSGSFWVSNMVSGAYQIEVQGPPAQTLNYFYVNPTNATQGASSNLIALARNALPLGQWAWSASAADERYAFKGEVGYGGTSTTLPWAGPSDGNSYHLVVTLVDGVPLFDVAIGAGGTSTTLPWLGPSDGHSYRMVTRLVDGVVLPDLEQL